MYNGENMVFKKFTALLSALLFSLLLFSCRDAEVNEQSIAESAVSNEISEEIIEESKEDISEESKAEERTAKPLLWKVVGENGGTVWLFASINVGNDELYPLPEAITGVFEASDVLAVEADTVSANGDVRLAAELLDKLAYSDKTTIKDHISEELYSRALALLVQNGKYHGSYDYYKPMYWVALISNMGTVEAGFDASVGTESYFLNAAREKEKTVKEISSISARYDTYGGFSDELQEALLENAVELRENGLDSESVKKLANAWLCGDEDVLLSCAMPEKEETEGVYLEYFEAMYTFRNQAIVDFCISALEAEENVFAVIGTAQLLDDYGVVDMLSSLGYSVERVEY